MEKGYGRNAIITDLLKDEGDFILHVEILFLLMKQIRLVLFCFHR